MAAPGEQLFSQQQFFPTISRTGLLLERITSDLFPLLDSYYRACRVGCKANPFFLPSYLLDRPVLKDFYNTKTQVGTYGVDLKEFRLPYWVVVDAADNLHVAALGLYHPI